MKTKPLSILITLILAALANTSASALEIIFADHRDTHSFQRISEFFTGQENPGRYLIARTDPERRDGFYVSIKADRNDPLDQFTNARISYIKTASQDIHISEIPLTGKMKKRILVGLTEEEWFEDKTYPHAWKIEFLDQSGQTLDSVQSFLWSLDK